jgi:hypothetical protein
METKLTVRVPQKLLKNAKRYAAAHHTTLTKLISAYLQRIPAGQDSWLAGGSFGKNLGSHSTC